MKNKHLRKLILLLAISVLTMLPASCAGKTAAPGLDEGGFITRELSVDRDGLSIYGIAYIPANKEGKFPTLIMCHGFSSSFASSIGYAESLARNGIASYIFDFIGGSANSRSDGSTLDMSVMTEVADLNAVIDFLTRLDFVDTDNLFLMGESQGGFVSALAAAGRSGDVKGLVLIYPAFVIPEDARKRYPSIQDIPERIPDMYMPLGKIYYRDIYDLDAYAAIATYKKDVLILHGDSDPVVPLEYSEKALQVYESAELVVFEGAGHDFSGDYADRALALMESFVKGHSSENK
jgi:pimeloyl-ACP methyl ester carboxylesterase